MTSDDPSAPDCRVLRSVELPDGRRVVVRRASTADVDATLALYERLSPEDLHRRFFTSRMPAREVVEEWVSPDRGGAILVAEVVGDGGQLVGEAGYSLLPDGDGELAITVDPTWRGWLGAWLLDALFDDAADHGVANLHADVLLLNRPMIAVLRHRGSATVDHPDLGLVRLVVGTTGHTPGWAPTGTKPRLLVEGVKGMWWGEQLAHAAGFDLRVCAGPGGVAERCPLLRGDECPLVEGADAVVPEFPASEPLAGDIVDAVRCRRPGLTVVVPGDEFDVAESAADLVDALYDDVVERASDPG